MKEKTQKKRNQNKATGTKTEKRKRKHKHKKKYIQSRILTRVNKEGIGKKKHTKRKEIEKSVLLLIDSLLFPLSFTQERNRRKKRRSRGRGESETKKG